MNGFQEISSGNARMNVTCFKAGTHSLDVKGSPLTAVEMRSEGSVWCCTWHSVPSLPPVPWHPTMAGAAWWSGWRKIQASVCQWWIHCQPSWKQKSIFEANLPVVNTYCAFLCIIEQLQFEWPKLLSEEAKPICSGCVPNMLQSLMMMTESVNCPQHFEGLQHELNAHHEKAPGHLGLCAAARKDFPYATHTELILAHLVSAWC